MVNKNFVANLLLNVSVKEFWKSVNIWRSYEQYYSGLFFIDSVYIRWGPRSSCVGTTFRGKDIAVIIYRVECQISNFVSSQYWISMQPIKRYGVIMQASWDMARRYGAV